MSESESSETDEELEAAPDLREWAPKDFPSWDRASTSKFEFQAGPELVSRLDSLLSEHKAATEKSYRMQRIRKELLIDRVGSDSEEDDDNDSSISDVALEQTETLARLEVVEAELPQQHPGMLIFAPEKFGCIFKELVSLSYCGFTPSNSSIDKLLAALTEETVENILLSRCLPVSFHKCSKPSSVMLWLFNLMSIHSSPLIVAACYENMATIIRQSKVKKSKVEGEAFWCPSALHLLKVFVNWGAECRDLLGRQTLYSAGKTSNILTATCDSSSAQRKKPRGQMCIENLRHVLMILTLCLQSKPDLQSEELNLMFHMVSKISLDVSLSNACVNRELQICLSSLLQCHEEFQWQGEVMCICRESLHLSEHHHNQVYLAELIFIDVRGSFLQTRLSFLFLCQILLPGWKPEDILDSNLMSLEPYFIASLGESSSPSSKSRLASCLQDLVNRDVYMTISALRLLDLVVGDEQRRADLPREQLEYIVDQVKLVTRSIRGNIRRLDLSRVKDVLAHLTDKWSFTLQTSKSIQKSILSWLTPGSHQLVLPEHVQDRRTGSPDNTDEERISMV